MTNKLPSRQSPATPVMNRELGGFGLRLTRWSFSMHGLWGSFRRNRGAAAVEFAVVAPIFFLLVFGMIEYGRMVMVQQMLTNASREGARRAILDGTTTSDVETTVNDYLASGRILGPTIVVSPNPPNSAEFGDPVTVTVQIDYKDVSWVPPWFLKTARMEAVSVMRRESVN